MKRNHASKYAEIDFSYKQDAKIDHFHGTFPLYDAPSLTQEALF